MSMRIAVLRERSVIEAAIWRNRLLLTIVTLHLLVAFSISLLTGTPFWTGAAAILLNIAKTSLIMMAFFLVVWRFCYGLFCARPKKPVRWLISDLRSFVLNPNKMADGLLCYLAVAVMATSFVFLKDMLPVLNPFSWDPQFVALDQWLHGGTDPWRLLWPVFGDPAATKLLDSAYVIWFFLNYITTFFAAFERSDPRRGLVFLVAFALTWIIGGNILATVFSSVGPVYYEAFGFGSDFVGQMAQLHELNESIPIWALNAQQVLLDGYTNDGALRGISAMPSMHVATSVVMTMFAFSYARWLGWVMSAFTCLILLGSVHLGWHYAVDGYFSVVLALVVWWVSKRLVARFGPEVSQI